jgi:hypothetical protein
MSFSQIVAEQLVALAMRNTRPLRTDNNPSATSRNQKSCFGQPDNLAYFERMNRIAFRREN